MPCGWAWRAGRFEVWLWERDNPAARAYFALATPEGWSQLNWRFQQVSVGTTDARLDSYFELKGAGAGAFAYRYR